MLHGGDSTLGCTGDSTRLHGRFDVRLHGRFDVRLHREFDAKAHSQLGGVQPNNRVARYGYQILATSVTR
jgi:hypothetical protein